MEHDDELHQKPRKNLKCSEKNIRQKKDSSYYEKNKKMFEIIYKNELDLDHSKRVTNPKPMFQKKRTAKSKIKIRSIRNWRL